MKNIIEFIKNIWTASIQGQLMLGIILVHAVLMTIFVFDLVNRQRDFLHSQSIEQAHSLTETLATNSTSWILANDIIGLEEVLQSQRRYPGLQYAMVLNPQGRVLGHTQREKTGLYISDDISKSLLQSTTKQQTLVDSPLLIDAASPIFSNNEFIGWARVGLGQEKITAGLNIITRDGIFYTIAAILIGALFAFFMAKGITKGLKHIVDVAEGIKLGNFNIRTNLRRKDELGRLAEDFNIMLDTIKQGKDDLSKMFSALQEREQDLAITLNSLADAMISTDTDLNIVRMNPVAEKLTGWSLKEATGKPINEIFSLIDAKSRRVIEDPINRIMTMRNQVTTNSQTILVSKTGIEFHITHSAAYIKNEDDLIGVVIVFNDVSEQYQLREANKKSRRDMQAIMDHSPAVISVKDKYGRYTFINQKFENLFKLSRENVIGKTDDELFEKSLAEVFKKSDDLLFLNEESLEVQETIPSQDKNENESRTFIANRFPLLNNIGEIYAVCAISTDITERKIQEEQLRRSQKMDALGKLTGGIAHDYNNLLGIIVGYTELLQMSIDPESRMRKYVDDIQGAAERGTKLTKKLLSFSLHSTPESNPIDVNKVLKEQRMMLEKTLTARIELSYHLEKEPWTVTLSKSDLSDAIVNMSINAMHAMETGGKLIIQTQNANITEVDASMLHLIPGEYLRLSFIDNGCGMNSTTLEKIFEPFYSTKGSQGTGLGLSQVYGFVDRSSGSIKVYSEPGRGARFDLFFPRSHENIRVTDAPSPLSETDYSGSETILVVDDEISMVNLASQILSEQGYKILSANDGKQALEILKTTSVQLLLTDVIMPNMDGYQLASRVQQLYPDIKIQMISGFSDDLHSRVSDQTLHENLLNKPYKAAALLKRIKTLLHKSTPEIIKDTTAKTILVMDDEENIRELFRINLKKLGYDTLTAKNGKLAIELYKEKMESGIKISACILDLSIPGGLNGKEVAKQIRQLDANAKILVSSGHSESPEMIDFSDYGFDGAMEKTFDRETMRTILANVLNT